MTTSWNLALLFKNDSDPKISSYLKQTKQQSYQFINKWKVRQDYLSDPVILKQTLDHYQQWAAKYGINNSAHYYFWLKLSLDQNNPELKARYNKIDDLMWTIQNDIQFFELNLAKINPKTQKLMLKSPLLKDYRHFLSRIFAQARYNLSDQEEKILNIKVKTSHTNWVQLTSGLLAKTDLTKLEGQVNDQNKKVRDQAAAKINQITKDLVDVAEMELNSVLSNKRMDDRLRGFTRPDQARHLSDDIQSQVVDQLVAVVSQNFDIPKQYYQLKSKLLGLPKLNYHERNLEYGQLNKPYSYQDSFKLVNQVMAKLDPQFSEVLQTMAKSGQIDVYPNKGKRGGAFCSYGLISDPVYILLNHTNRLKDVLTLAHEFGHALNDQLIKQSQHSLNFGTPLSTAEVASTFLEDFVFHQLLQTADKKLKLALLMSKLNDDISTIFRQIAFYRFETELHRLFDQQGYLSHQQIGKLFRRHMKSYMGNSVIQTPGTENWWVFISHFRSFFYVYSYASGQLISKALQARVKQDPKYIAQVKLFLSKGLSQSPEQIFSEMDIDIKDPKFWQQGIDEIRQLLTEVKILASS